MLSQSHRIARRSWVILRLAVKQYSQIDGSHRAAACAYYGFFSLFPLLILVITIASAFVDRDKAGDEIIGYVNHYVPLSTEVQQNILGTIAGVVRARGQAGAIALLMLAWTSNQVFMTLIAAANRAWDTEYQSWWRLPLKSLLILGIMVAAGLASLSLPVLARLARAYLFAIPAVGTWTYDLGTYLVQVILLFGTLTLFYRLAPRHPLRFVDVWTAAISATLLLQTGECFFVIYLKDFAHLNAVYGAFGGIIALLMWIHLSASIVIFGACLAAGQAQSATGTSVKPSTLPSSNLAT